MISFDLRCSNEHVFEAWFANSAVFDAQTRAREVSCPVCGDHTLAKALMAPNVSVGGSNQESQAMPAAPVAASSGTTDRFAELVRAARALRAEVEKNFDFVGNSFAEEAKKIHYGEVEHRNIYGEMNGEEAGELKEEGIEFGVLPWSAKEDA